MWLNIGLLSIRHNPKSRLGKSDIYCTCLLQPLDENQPIVIQEEEIAAAKWMDLDQFLKLPYYKGLYRKIMEIGAEAALGNYDGWIVESLPIVFQSGHNQLYHGYRSKSKLWFLGKLFI